MKKEILALLVTFFSFATIVSQNIKGTIVNANTSEPLSDITVIDPVTGAGTVSDINGQFSIDTRSLPVTLHISAIGYISQQVAVTSAEEVVVYLTRSAEDLAEVVLRSTLIPSQLRKTPAAVSVISSQDLNRIDETNLAQAFNNVPGIYVNQGALNTTKLTIRGIGARSQYSTNRIQAYIDGIPLTTAEGELTLDDIDAEGLSHIEIIKGPTSSIYGAGLGGVINLYAKQVGEDQSQAGVKTLFGSYNMIKKTATASYGTENTSLFVNFNDLQSDGYRENGSYSRQSGIARASLTTSNGNLLSFIANFTRLKAYIPSSLNEDDFLNDPTSAAFTWAQSQGYESYDRGLLGVSYQAKIASNFTNLTSLYLNFRDAYEPRPFDILKEERVSAGARTRFNLDTQVFNWPFQVSFGAEYYREWYETGTFENLYEEFEDMGSVAGQRLSNNEQDRDYSNFFAQLRMGISEKLHLEAGLNVNTTQYKLTDLYVQDEVDQTGDYKFNSIVSPRIGATYEIGTDKNVYASVSHGFSTPTVAETLTPEGLINTSLKPESGFNYEIGFKGNWLNNRLYAEIAVYSIQIDDLLVAERVAEDRYVGVNAGKTSHNGAEVFLSYSFYPGVDFVIKPYFNGAFNHYEFKEFNNRELDYSGNKLPGVPESTMNVGVDATYARFSFFGNLLGVGQIPLNDDNAFFTDPYTVVNLKATYRLRITAKVDINLTAGVNNLLEEKYAASVLPNAVGFGGASPRFYYPGNARNYFGGVGVNYIF